MIAMQRDGGSDGDRIQTHSPALDHRKADDLGKLGKFHAVAAFDYESISPIDALDRPYTTGIYSSLSPKYPDRATSIIHFLSGFSGVNTGNFYTVPVGTRTGPTTLNINGDHESIYSLLTRNCSLETSVTADW
jgi:hypothetical protein